MTQIVALNCPVCSAPFSPGKEQCAFCGAFVVIKTNLPKLERHTLNQALIQEHIVNFRNRVRSNEYDEEAFYGLGIAYFSLGLVDDAIEELTRAARLMPENVGIQTQLAVALREKARAGDSSAAALMQRRVELTLKLEPDNLEALSMKAGLLAASGDTRQATVLLGQIERISQPKANDTRNEILVRRIESGIASGDWYDAKVCLRSLEKSDPAKARKILTEYLSTFQNLLPLELVDLGRRRRSEQLLYWATGAALLVGAVVTISILGADASGAVRGVSVVVAIAVFVAPILGFQYLMDSREAASAFHISSASIRDPKESISYLIEAVDAIRQFESGNLGNRYVLGRHRPHQHKQ